MFYERATDDSLSFCKIINMLWPQKNYPNSSAQDTSLIVSVQYKCWSEEAYNQFVLFFPLVQSTLNPCIDGSNIYSTSAALHAVHTVN